MNTEPPYLESAFDAISQRQVSKLHRLQETYPDFDINIQNYSGLSLLSYLLEYGRFEYEKTEFQLCLKWLLEQGIDVNSNDNVSQIKHFNITAELISPFHLYW